jgi:Spy/CpxP family protein refolding chaperone
MKNWKSILLLALVFFAGIAVGVVGTRVAVRHFVQRALAQPERFQLFIEREMKWKLRLDDSQQLKLHEILTDSRGQMRDLRQQIHPQMVLVWSNTDSQISAMLTPEQQARYDKFKEANRPLLHILHPGAP